MTDSRAEDVFWKWLLATSAVIIVAVLVYAFTARSGGEVIPASTPSLTLGVPDKIALVAAEGKEGSGESERVWDGLEFLLTVQAALPKPGDGRAYIAWLSTAGSVEGATKVGKLELDEACSCYRVVYRNDTDQRDKAVVFVTEETNDDDIQETRFLEGRFPLLPGQLAEDEQSRTDIKEVQGEREKAEEPSE